MQININPQGRDLQTDNTISPVGHSNAPRMAEKTTGYKLDISSKDKDINAFGMEQLKSMDDVRKKASLKNVSLEHNALAVMSTSMSGEDFAKISQEGFSVENLTPDESVTILDKIKATLAQSGVVVPGYTDDLSSEEIEIITGSASYAAAIESSLKENQLPITEENVSEITDVIKVSEEVGSVSDDAKKYMITNELEPTVKNFYMAEHSSSEKESGGKAHFYKDSTGYVGKNPIDVDFEELRPQAEKIIEQSGLPVNEKTLNDAKWLITKDIPLTKENLESLSDINSIQFPISEKVIADSSAAMMADGYKAEDANLTATESTVTKAARIMTKTLADLDKMEKSDISARRMIEEARLHLTSEANLALLKKGITTDTSDLQALVENLKQAEKEVYEPFLMSEKRDEVAPDKVSKFDDELSLKIDLFKQTMGAADEIKSAPLAFVGDVINETAHTFGEVSNAAASHRAAFEGATKSYETLMTSPRADMGDSIKKAFRNVDDILEDLNLEVTRLNEKAVRTLGYAQMEISESNIEKAVNATVALENVATHMTPGRVLQMIRDGENPLDLNIFELADKLMKEDVETDSRKYSEFLYKLEKSGNITEAEKSSFIGIFRLLRKIEKSDGRLTGDVLKSDDELTLSNLLTASRSDRQIGTDIKIDDSFGAIEKLITHGESITDQILAAFRTDKDLEAEYEGQQAKEVKTAFTKEQAVIDAIENFEIPDSAINMTAMDALINMRGSAFRTLKDISAKKSEDSDNDFDFDDEVSCLHESFDDEETAKEAYEKFVSKSEEVIKNEADLADKYIDVRSMKLVSKQLSIMTKMTDSKTYEVPAYINGELTSINLKIVSDSENSGKVNVAFETEQTGRVSAEFTCKDGEISGFIVTSNSYFTDVIKEKENGLKSEFAAADIKATSLYYTSSRGVSLKGNYTEKTEGKQVSNKQLYKVAKAVIKALQK